MCDKAPNCACEVHDRAFEQHDLKKARREAAKQEENAEGTEKRVLTFIGTVGELRRWIQFHLERDRKRRAILSTAVSVDIQR